ncbi:membrane protein [Desulfurella multipotens]|jgi:uncharacterized membrane-anchored protein|uniref:COG4705 family protein n=1 Tax=Desulfurella TaxID=33001 RepID=UPI0003E08E51|nr:membrane protein [Desulfurella multipotens]AHF97183.1 membrane protein [Desulfurella acetivorans A63]PMP62780.1 MAG: hypothetical protein C0192_08600 [Desulfurella multipotens]
MQDLKEPELLNKVAQVGVIFWLTKIVATTLGETFGDFLSMTLSLGYSLTLVITMSFLAITLFAQLSSKKYVPLYFWLAIIGTTTVGTEISDLLDRTLHLGYPLGSLILSSALFATLFLWYKKYRDLSIYPMTDFRKEVFFWVAVLFSNSLGTAFGDFLSDSLRLSYLGGTLVTSAVILIVLSLHYFSKVSPVVLFWVAFVFTRPFGATFGDLLTKPVNMHGLELGTLNASIVEFLIISFLIFIAHLRLNRQNMLSCEKVKKN